MHPLYEDMFQERWGSLSYCDEKIGACDLKPTEDQCGDHGGRNADSKFGSQWQGSKKTMLSKAWSFCLPIDERYR